MNPTSPRWQQLVALTRRLAASSRNGRACVRLFCAFITIASCGLTDLAAQTGTGSVQGRIENAISGNALNLARVTVKGTNRETFSNEYGDYQLTDLSAGDVELTVSYTGLAAQTVKVAVTAGAATTQDFQITSARMAEAGPGDDALKLDTFTVSTQRDTNAASIAANEQRYSSSLKSVVSADAFGDVTEGNIGEFMKYLPGVSVDYVAADVRTMSVRGFADNFTSVSVNGARMASSSSGAGSRSFEFEQVSINNVSRIEISKAPTPSMPADSLGGAVNLVSKNAFERKGVELKYKVYLSLNSENLDLFKKTDGPMNKRTYKGLPGFDFDYTLPVSKTFGLVVTGLSSNQFNEQHRTQNTYEFARAGATDANPYLQQYQFQDGPKNTFRNSLSLKADWKVRPHHVLSASLQTNYYLSQFGNRNFAYNIGTTATPTTSGGQALVWTPTSVTGASGRGSVQGQTSFRDKYGATTAGNVTWTYKENAWEVDASLNASRSRTWYRDTARGHFSEVRTALAGVSRISFTDINPLRPGGISVYNAAGTLIDPTLLSNYTITFGRGNPIDAYDQFAGGNLNAKYNLNLSFPAALKVGVDQRTQNRNIRRYDQSWNLAGTVTGADYVDQSYLNQDPYWGLPAQQWPDSYKLYALMNSTPAAFAQTAAQQLAAERFRIQNSQYLEETISSAYAQAELKLLNGRLGLVTGVRFEKTEDLGRGPKTKGPINTLPLLQANLIERGYETNASYDGYYPSFHATYAINDQLLARFSYSTSLGRPDFANILPLARVNDTGVVLDDGLSPTIPPLTVIVTNTALKPWDGESYDFSLEYYFPKGGVLSGGYFIKNLSDFWGTANRIVTAQDIADFDLDATALGLNLQTTVNVGNAKITGFEFNFQKSLDFLPGIARDFSVFANATKLNLSGPKSADFAKFIEESASWGVTYSHKPVVLSLKWNYRGRQRLGAQTGSAFQATGVDAGFREYYAPRTFLDVNAEYQFSKRFTAFANARNILNVAQTLERYNDVSPDYTHQYRIEEFGIQIAVGIKGTF